MGQLNDKITNLELLVAHLQSQIQTLTERVQARRIKPESRVAQTESKMEKAYPSTGTGLGKLYNAQGTLIWNNSYNNDTPWGTQPAKPTKGYNKHSHSSLAGGALDINTLELVEYDTDEDGDIIDINDQKLNRHCQAYWKKDAKIAKEGSIDKIGTLDISFDATSGKWIAGAGNIDVETTYLVQYEVDDDGNRTIKLDANGVEMKSRLLYTASEANENLNKSNVWWDKDAGCWRFYAVFKPAPEEEE